MVDAQKPHRFRMTRQCRLILQELGTGVTHPSAEELFGMVRKKLPRISLGTVYRNLEKLCQMGAIQKHEFGGTLNRFDGNPELHYHIRCTCCDRVANAPLDLMHDLEQKITFATEYKLISHRLEFIGLCPECARNMVSPGLEKANRGIVGSD